MKKIVIPSVLLILFISVFLYLKTGFSGNSFDGSRYLNIRVQIDSLNTLLWNAEGKLKSELLNSRDSLWNILNAFQNPSSVSDERVATAATSSKKEKKESEFYFWIFVVVLLTIVLLVLIVFILRKKQDAITRQMEQIREGQRFKSPKGGFQEGSEFMTRTRVRRSIVEEAATIAESEGRIPAEKTIPKDFLFEDENGVPENKILSESQNNPDNLKLRPTARDRITSAMQSLSEVLLKSPKGVSREKNTMKVRVQSRNTIETTLFSSDDTLEEHRTIIEEDFTIEKPGSPLELTRFDKEREDKEKIHQMMRRGYTSSEIARRMQMEQEQVETMIRIKRESGE